MKRMKQHLKLLSILGAALGLGASVSLAQIAPNYPAFNHFDTPLDANGRITNWYGQPSYLSWDGTQDAGGGGPGSGSLYVQADYSAIDNYAMGLAFDTNYLQFNSTTVVTNGYLYTNLEYDIKWDSAHSSIPLDVWNSTGDPQGAGIGLLTMPGVGQVPITNVNVYIPQAASNGWVHINQPIGRTLLPGIDQIMGLWFKKYYNGVLGTMAFWIDNVQFDGGPILPPPTISLTQTHPSRGLKFVADTSGQYDRQNIITYDDNFSWVGNGATPYTYAVNLLQMPGAANAGFVYHIFLVPGSATEASPDWNEPNVIYLDIENTGSGGGSVQFRYKTNAPNDNGGFFGPNNLGFITDTTVLGTWRMSFQNDTNVTMVTPSGNSTNFNMGVNDAVNFSGPLEVYFGIMPNQGNNIGQTALVGNVGITNGGTTLLFDDFTTDSALKTNVTGGFLLSTTGGNGADANAVFLISAVTPNFVITWPYPNGFAFNIETNNSLTAPGNWSTNGLPLPANSGVTKVIQAPVSSFPSGKLFFRLANPGP